MSDYSEESSDVTAQRDTSAERWLFAEARNIRGLLLAIIALAAGIGLLVVFQARLLASACQRVVIQGEGVSSVAPLAAVLVLLAAGRGICTYILEIKSAAAAARVKLAVRSTLYRKLQSLGAVGLAGDETGPLIETVTRGVDELEPYFTRFLPQLVLAAILPLMFLIIIVPSEWRSGLVLLFSAPCIPLFMILIGRGSEHLHRRQWGRLSRMAGHLLDLIQGLPDLVIFGAAKEEATGRGPRFGRVSHSHHGCTASRLPLRIHAGVFRDSRDCAGCSHYRVQASVGTSLPRGRAFRVAYGSGILPAAAQHGAIVSRQNAGSGCR